MSSHDADPFQVAKAGFKFPKHDGIGSSIDSLMQAVVGMGGSGKKTSARRGPVTPGRTPALPPGPAEPKPGGGKPFLHPKAPPYNTIAHQQKMMNKIDPYESSPARQLRPAAREARRRGKTQPAAGIDMLPTGPRADAKTRAALSGDTVSETVSRIGRATRHQDKEFHARIHPLSGRVEDMVRGDHLSAHVPTGTPTRARRRMVELSESKNYEVATRAKASLTNENPNLVGPNRLYVHNHSDNPGGRMTGPGLERQFPSAMDTNLVHQMGEIEGVPAFKGAVVTRNKEGKRGDKKTHVTYFGPAPDKVRVPRRMAPKGKRLKRADSWERRETQGRMIQHDIASSPDGLPLRAQEGMSRRVVNSSYRESQKDMREASKPKHLIRGWDEFVRGRTQKPKKAVKTGIHTREQLVKRLTGVSGFGVDHGGEIAKREPIGPIVRLGRGVARPVIDLGWKNQIGGLARIDGLPTNNKAKLSPADAKKFDRGYRQAVVGRKIRLAGQKAYDHAELTGTATLATGAVSAGGAAGSYNQHRRKKKAVAV